MDPLSITAAAIGISGAAIANIVGLRNTISKFQDAEEVVGDIRMQLDNIERPLDSLKTLTITDAGTLTASTEALTRSGVAEAVNKCGKACEAFDKKLQKWTKHSSGEKLTLRDRMTVGVWNKEKILTFKTRVDTCQSNVQFAVSSVQLILQQKQMGQSDAGYEKLSQQMHNLELQAREQIILVRKQQERLEQRERELALNSDSEDESAEQVAASNEVKQQFRLLDESQISLGVVFAQVRAARTHQVIGNVTTDRESFALVGIPERLVGKIDQQIGDVSTTDKSAAVVGVFDSSVDMRDLLFRRT